MKAIKRINGSKNDVRVAIVNGRAVAVLMKIDSGYAVDELYTKEEKHFSKYNEAREAALNAPALLQ